MQHADTSDATPTVEKKADLNGVGLTLNKHSRESKNSAYLRIETKKALRLIHAVLLVHPLHSK